MRVLVDTNILLRSAQHNHPLRSPATPAVSKLLRENNPVFADFKRYNLITALYPASLLR